jgi:hypothetical protein
MVVGKDILLCDGNMNKKGAKKFVVIPVNWNIVS